MYLLQFKIILLCVLYLPYKLKNYLNTQEFSIYSILNMLVSNCQLYIPVTMRSEQLIL